MSSEQLLTEQLHDDIDTLLEQQLIGSKFDQELSSSDYGLSQDHQFSWENIMNNPKGNHGIYESRGSWYKTMKYEVLHSGGFLRLFTSRGRIYWNAQNESEHTTPDWKFHFSCDLNQIGMAWNSLTALFVDMKCEIGMKVTVHDYDSNLWSENQRGREITVYVYRYHNSYKDYMQGVIPNEDHDLYLGLELHEVYTPIPFWYTFIINAEKRLHSLGIISRGCADGDLKLPGCKYASLRNEAFVKIPRSIAYPNFNNKEIPTSSPSLNKEVTVICDRITTDKKGLSSIVSTNNGAAEENETMETRREEDEHQQKQKDYGGSGGGGGDDKKKNTSTSGETPSVTPQAVDHQIHQEKAEGGGGGGGGFSTMVLAYPPNNTGWNAAKHQNPMLELIFLLREFEKYKEKLDSQHKKEEEESQNNDTPSTCVIS